ncbi:hypothetical protein ACLOJK_041096 [Asimina triloba]
MAADPLDLLRPLMASQSLDALVVPSEDYHQSEYVSDRDKRRQFVSGFSGSAGLALITMDDARLWTDGRYFLQATQQLSDRWKLMRLLEDPAVENWIADNLPSDASIGVDPWCISVDTAQSWEHTFLKNKQKLVQLSTNLVDEVWKTRPPQEIRPVIVQPLEFAGCSIAEKLKDLREKLAQENAYAIIVTTLDEVAWLYNVRGSDVSYCPVVHSFAIVTTDSAFFYVDKRKVSAEVGKHLTENGIEVRDYDSVASDVSLLASGKKENEGKENKHSLVWVDPSTCCLALYTKLASDQVLLKQSPLALAKAIKNHAELEGLKKAHIRDGAAVVQYLVWLDNEVVVLPRIQFSALAIIILITASAASFCGSLPTLHNVNSTDATDIWCRCYAYVCWETLKLTEVSASDKLEAFRAKQEHFKGLSFPTISSVGPNAAIIHYEPDAESCSELDADKIYLFDSGAQVLKGHIALGNARFPNGTTGHALDILARVPLWKDGLDYRHGTGHGIGSYLNVHEEPGYYEDGNFGIRLENVLIVKEADTKFNFGDKGYLSFENITWAPYQKKLMDVSLLTPEELQWVNEYHSACRKALSPYMDERESAWLIKATESIGA